MGAFTKFKRSFGFSVVNSYLATGILHGTSYLSFPRQLLRCIFVTPIAYNILPLPRPYDLSWFFSLWSHSFLLHPVVFFIPSSSRVTLQLLNFYHELTAIQVTSWGFISNSSSLDIYFQPICTYFLYWRLETLKVIHVGWNPLLPNSY